jgi:hypothetical protein
MVKKLFALASVTALTGLIATAGVAGCSSTTVQDASGDSAAPTGDGGKDASKPKTDGSADEDSGEPATGTCPTLDPIDATALPWKSPTKLLGACTAKELSDLVTYVDANSSAKYADWKKTVTGASCSSCIFGKETDATWKPLLEDAKGQLVGLNVDSCIAIASGNDKCGQSYQNWFDCRFEACTDCADGDTAALQKCLTNASKGACKKAFDDVGTVCGDTAIGDAETACTGDKFVFEGPIKAQCIGLAEGGE